MRFRKNGRIDLLSEAEIRPDFIAWHREGWRAKFAELLVHFPHRFKSKIRDVARDVYYSLRCKRSWRALKNARALSYHTIYVHAADAVESEGWIKFKGGELTLVVTCTGAYKFKADAIRWDWEHSYIADHDYPNPAQINLWVPADHLTPELVTTAIKRWYVEHYQFHRGHWTVLEDSTPEVTIAFEWLKKTEAQLIAEEQERFAIHD